MRRRSSRKPPRRVKRKKIVKRIPDRFPLCWGYHWSPPQDHARYSHEYWVDDVITVLGLPAAKVLGALIGLRSMKNGQVHPTRHGLADKLRLSYDQVRLALRRLKSARMIQYLGRRTQKCQRGGRNGAWYWIPVHTWRVTVGEARGASMAVTRATGRWLRRTKRWADRREGERPARLKQVEKRPVREPWTEEKERAAWDELAESYDRGGYKGSRAADLWEYNISYGYGVDPLRDPHSKKSVGCAADQWRRSAAAEFSAYARARVEANPNYSPARNWFHGLVVAGLMVPAPDVETYAVPPVYYEPLRYLADDAEPSGLAWGVLQAIKAAFWILKREPLYVMGRVKTPEQLEKSRYFKPLVRAGEHFRANGYQPTMVMLFRLLCWYRWTSRGIKGERPNLGWLVKKDHIERFSGWAQDTMDKVLLTPFGADNHVKNPKMRPISNAYYKAFRALHRFQGKHGRGPTLDEAAEIIREATKGFNIKRATNEARGWARQKMREHRERIMLYGIPEEYLWPKTIEAIRDGSFWPRDPKFKPQLRNGRAANIPKSDFDSIRTEVGPPPEDTTVEISPADERYLVDVSNEEADEIKLLGAAWITS